MIKVCSRITESLESISAEDLARKIILGRNLDPNEFLKDHSLSNITPPFSLKNVSKACLRLWEAIENNETIGILSDHDCDGQTACAVLYCSLTQVFCYPADKIVIFIGHRTEEGYGITEKLSARILSSDNRPSVMITADCGSSDEPNIAVLQENGIDIIVTDHHQIPPSGPPKSAYAVINPQQAGCDFPDKHIAGCGIAWFVICALRSFMMEKTGLSYPSMAPLLDFVAIGTLSDCVSLTKSFNNRIILKYGLKKIRQGARPCWRVLKNLYNDYIDCEFLIFKLIPLINADGRLSNALGGIEYLTSQDMVSAQEQIAMLIETNHHRKELQKKQLILANSLVNATERALIINLGIHGHHGIHGVSASRLSEEFQKMAIIFSQIDSDPENPILSGSSRAPEGHNIKALLDVVHKADPSLLLRYGGHAQAAGLSLYAKNFDKFKKTLLDICSQSAAASFNEDIFFDAILPASYVQDLEFLGKTESYLEPFGKDFKKPSFALWGHIVDGRAVGSDKNHIQLTLQLEQGLCKAMLFFCSESKEFLAAHMGRPCLWVGEFSLETYRKTSQYVLFVKGAFDTQKSTWSTGRVQQQNSHLCIGSI